MKLGNPYRLAATVAGIAVYLAFGNPTAAVAFFLGGALWSVQARR